VDENRPAPSGATARERKLLERVSALERLNAELSAREERFRSVFVNSAAGIVVTQDGVFKLASPNVYEIFGLNEDVLASKPFIELIHPDDREMVAERHVRHLRGEDVQDSYTARVLTAGGEMRWAEIRSVQIDWEGRPASLSFVVDATQRIEDERSLRDSETLYRSLFDQANDAIFLVRGDEFIDCNAKTLEMFGCTREQIIGQPPYRFSPPQQADGRDSKEAAVDRIAATLEGAPQRFEWLHARYDGSVFEAEVSLSNIEIGGERLIFAFVSDISERKWLERIQSTLLEVSQTAHTALTLEELFTATRETLSALMDTTNFYVALYDELSGTYRFECFHDEHDELELHTPRDGAGSVTDYVRRTGEPLLLSATGFKVLEQNEGVRCGGTRSKSWLGVPLRTARGVIGVAVVQDYESESTYSKRELDLMSFVAEHIATAVERLRDEEERVRLEQQVRQAQRLESLGVLAGGIAHDFNNLLTGILGNADLALLDLPRSSSAAMALNEIRGISQRASDLCRQMLAYSGRAASAPEQIDLADEVSGMRDTLESLTPDTVTFEFDTPPSGVVSADRTQLAQIVRALVANAAESLSGEPGSVRVATGTIPFREAALPNTSRADSPAGGTACPFIEVADSGCGMDEETQQRVFEPFFSTKFTGRGLGLPAVQGIVRMHGGTIDLTSVPDEGTTVRIVFPPADVERTATGSEAVPVERPAEPARQRVLLVDDEDIVRKVGETLLDKAGYSVTTAEDGRTALDFFRAHADEVACVVLDLSMPDMDGEQVFQQMRDVRSDVPILISSGYSGNDVMRRFEQSDAWAFLQKPFSSESLVSSVSRLAGGPDTAQ